MKKIYLILTVVIFCGTICHAQNNKSEATTLRVLTFNILHGATTKGDFDLDKIASIIKESNPDLVALQEVDFKTKRAKNYDLATELGWRTKMASLFGKAMDFDGGAYGVGILTKMPILSSRTINLPCSPNNEPRAALEVTIELESGDTICFIATHLQHKKDNPDRMHQVKKINEVFASGEFPSILAGDLNDTPESEAISILRKQWTDSYEDKPKPTYSSKNPQMKIDYIMFRPVQYWKVVESRVICDTIASDHCSVLSVLKLVK